MDFCYRKQLELKIIPQQGVLHLIIIIIIIPCVYLLCSVAKANNCGWRERKTWNNFVSTAMEYCRIFIKILFSCLSELRRSSILRFLHFGDEILEFIFWSSFNGNYFYFKAGNLFVKREK